MRAKEKDATVPICLKVTPEFIRTTIRPLMMRTGLSRSAVIKLALSEMADRRIGEKRG